MDRPDTPPPAAPLVVLANGRLVAIVSCEVCGALVLAEALELHRAYHATPPEGEA